MARGNDYPKPAVRRLRVYAFDPHASVELATAVINDAVIELPWETRWESPVEMGPVNDYVEVIDHDPAADVFYAPVDLNNAHLLAQNGLAPSEGRPQFHQQMVFAVVMRTIRTFDRALGRSVIWAGPPEDPEVIPPTNEDGTPKAKTIEQAFTRRLRVYPHALREANAYYSPKKRALLFGYFKTEGDDGDTGARWVFTCLSQDIIAHETTHAILHGMQQRSLEPSNVDALAFHEAFADIVALLQHFEMTDVLKHLLGQNKGSLREPGLLNGLAQQFGMATGEKGALRRALDLLQIQARAAKNPDARKAEEKKEEEKAEGKKEDGDHNKKSTRETFSTTFECHARGAYLVAAVFDAFVTIYEHRSADLLRLARFDQISRNGQSLPPDLVNRLAQEASKSADQVLRMCIRALDYVPPIDLRFGEYLRAIITADMDLVPNDPKRYRIAFVEAFKRWGITVPGALSMAPDSLAWDGPQPDEFRKLIAMAKKDGVESEDDVDALSHRFLGLLKRLQLGVSFTEIEDNSHRLKKLAHTLKAEEPKKSGLKLANIMAILNAARRLLAPVNQSVVKNERGKTLTTGFSSDDYSKGARNLRYLAMRVILHNQEEIFDWFNASTEGDEDWEKMLGMRLLPDKHDYRSKDVELAPLGGLERSPQIDAVQKKAAAARKKNPKKVQTPVFTVHSARISRRAGPDGQELHMLIIQLSQRRRGYFDPEMQRLADKKGEAGVDEEEWKNPDFWFYGGATVQVDLRDGRLLRIIRKRVDNNARLEQERRFRIGEETDQEIPLVGNEPFAFMHREHS